MRSLKQCLTEKNNGGLAYEKTVRSVIREVSKAFPSIKLLRASGKGSFSAHDVDLSLEVNKKKIDIEIKKNLRAQMGGVSVGYDGSTFSLNKAEDFDDETVELIIKTIASKKRDIDKTLKWFEKNDPVYQYNKSPGFPLRVSNDAWQQAIKEDVVKALNIGIRQNAEFIANYYKTKNVSYMQIGGGAGLFYLKDNPLDLPIPQLEGEIMLEFRAGKSGIKVNKSDGYEYSTVILRLQGRLQFKGKSKYSLDNPEQTEKLFSLMVDK